MGCGIAQLFAQAGLDVILFDLSENQLAKAKSEIAKNLDFAVSKHKISQADKENYLLKRPYYLEGRFDCGSNCRTVSAQTAVI